jgi:hypothetical protein
MTLLRPIVIRLYYLVLSDGIVASKDGGNICLIYIIVIIINLLQSTAGHRPLHFLAILLDLRLFVLRKSSLHIYTYIHTYIQLSLYLRSGSRGILNIPPRHPRFTKVI